MTIGYRDSWDDIQGHWNKHTDGDHTQQKLAENAFKVKSAVETIEQQKRIGDFQASILEQQRKNLEQQKQNAEFTANLVEHQMGMTRATRRLALFTALLVIVTLAYTVINGMSLSSSNKQLTATMNLVDASQDLSLAVKLMPLEAEKIWGMKTARNKQISQGVLEGYKRKKEALIQQHETIGTPSQTNGKD